MNDEKCLRRELSRAIPAPGDQVQIQARSERGRSLWVSISAAQFSAVINAVSAPVPPPWQPKLSRAQWHALAYAYLKDSEYLSRYPIPFPRRNTVATLARYGFLTVTTWSTWGSVHEKHTSIAFSFELTDTGLAVLHDAR